MNAAWALGFRTFYNPLNICAVSWCNRPLQWAVDVTLKPALMTRRTSTILVSLGLVTSVMAVSFLSVALYSSDLACGIFSVVVLLAAICEFGIAAFGKK